MILLKNSYPFNVASILRNDYCQTCYQPIILEEFHGFWLVFHIIVFLFPYSLCSKIFDQFEISSNTTLQWALCPPHYNLWSLSTIASIVLFYNFAYSNWRILHLCSSFTIWISKMSSQCHPETPTQYPKSNFIRHSATCRWKQHVSIFEQLLVKPFFQIDRVSK